MYEIVHHEQRSDTTFLWEVLAPDVAQSADTKAMESLFEQLTRCKDDEQQRNWMLYEDEQIIISYAFASQESTAIEELHADLRCVEANDTLAPEECRPGTTPTASCPNPDRLTSCDSNTCLNGAADNMSVCSASWLSITNPNLIIDVLPANTAIGLNYGLLMGSTIPDLQEVEFVLEITAPTAGLSGVSRAVVRQTLDADELRTFYSTDHPTGGTTIADINNNAAAISGRSDCGRFVGKVALQGLITLRSSASGVS